MYSLVYTWHGTLHLDKTTLKTLIQLPDWLNKNINAELCVVYGTISSVYPYKTYISYTFFRQPISRYIMPTITAIKYSLFNFIGSSYT